MMDFDMVFSLLVVLVVLYCIRAASGVQHVGRFNLTGCDYSALVKGGGYDHVNVFVTFRYVDDVVVAFPVLTRFVRTDVHRVRHRRDRYHLVLRRSPVLALEVGSFHGTSLRLREHT